MRYLYYKLWQTFKKIPTNDMPATNAMIVFSILHFINIATIQVLVNHFFSFNIEPNSKNEIILFACSLGLVLYLINYFYLYKNREKLYEKYKDESKSKSIIGNTSLVLYIIASAALVYYFGSRYPL
jgi:hypothetical protein